MLKEIDKDKMTELETKLCKLLAASLERRIKARPVRDDRVRQILLALLNGLSLPAALVLPNIPKTLAPLIDSLADERGVRSRDIIRTIRSLKRRELIATSRGKLTITDQGRRKLFIESLNEITIPRPSRWDGRWRIILFDIPNEHSRARDALRGMFHQLGLRQIQRSAYVYPYPLTEEVGAIASLFGVADYLVVIEATAIDGDEALLHHFRLSR